MHRILPIGLLILLPWSASAQIQVGGASFFHGDQVVYTGGAGQPPQAKDVGIGLKLGFVSAPAQAETLERALAAFSPSTCAGTQVRLEVKLRKRALARKETRLPALSRDVLKDLPNDPEAEGNYSWWNYETTPEGDGVRCKRHPSFRKLLKELPTPPDP